MAFRLSKLIRAFSSEFIIIDKIKAGLGDDTEVDVLDLSDGCGTMFQIRVTSPKFNGGNIIQQHKMVNKCIKGEDIHGFRLETFPLIP